MISAVDTSVLLDVFGNDPVHAGASLAALRQGLAEGELIACEVVWSEVAALFPRAAAMSAAMDRIPVTYVPLDSDAALAAGTLWSDYRKRGGRRTRMIADFLVGAHAATQAERLITRDRGFYRDYFRKLKLLDPSGR